MKFGFILFFFLIATIVAQAQFNLQVLSTNSNESSTLEKLKREVKLKTTFTDELSAKNELNKIIFIDIEIHRVIINYI